MPPSTGSRRWCHPGDCGYVTPSSVSVRGSHLGVCGHLTPGTSSIRVSLWRICIFDPKKGQGDGYPRDCGHVIPGAGSERWGHPGDSGHVTTDAEFGKGVTLETGRVIPGTVPGRGHPGDCKLFPQEQGLGGGSLWRLWTCVLRCCIRGGGHHGYCGRVSTGTGPGSCGHPGDCGCLTIGKISERWGFTRYCGHVCPGTSSSEMEPYWRL